jgi:hypothetical protein
MKVKEKFADWPGKNRLSIRDSARFALVLAAIGCVWSALAVRYGLTWYVVGPYILEPGRHLVATWMPQPFMASRPFSALSFLTAVTAVYGIAARLLCAGYIKALGVSSGLDGLKIRHPFQGLWVGWIAGSFAQIVGCAWFAIGAIDGGGADESWLKFSIAVGILVFVAAEHALRNAVDFYDPLDLWSKDQSKSAEQAGAPS